MDRSLKSLLCSVVLMCLVGSGCAARNFGEKSLTASLPKTEIRKEFANYNSSVVCKTEQYVVAKSSDEVVEVVKNVRQLKRSLRVVSHELPHSYSPIICPKDAGVIINVGTLNKILSVDLFGSVPTAKIQPGVILFDLQKHLDPLGFTFPVSPDYNRVTMAGAMGAGAHHSSLRIPSSIADWVEEMVIVDGTGVLKTLKGNELDLVRVHLGLVGVIVEMTVRIVPQYKLKYAFERNDDSKIAEEIETKIRSHDFARVRWFPTQSKYVLDSFDKVPVSTPGESYDTSWTSVPDLTALGNLPAEILNGSRFANCSAEFIRVNTFAGAFKNVQSERGTIVGKSHNMIAGGCKKGECPWDKGTKGRTVEVAFPLSRLKDWMKDVRSVLGVRQACFPANGLYLRFSQASKGALAQASGEDAVMFEIHIAVGDGPEIEQWSDVYDEIVQMTLAKHNGRPHWGKNSTPYFIGLGSKQFPLWNDFEAKRKQLDPDGIFVSKLWNVMAEEKATGVYQPKGIKECGVMRECICKLDSKLECGANAKCEAGGFFTDARVCRK